MPRGSCAGQTRRTISHITNVELTLMNVSSVINSVYALMSKLGNVNSSRKRSRGTSCTMQRNVVLPSVIRVLSRTLSNMAIEKEQAEARDLRTKTSR